MTRLCAAVWLAASLAGCAAFPDGAVLVARGRAALDAAAPCCKTLADARRTPLPPERAEIRIDETSQAHDFGSGKVFFAMFELPSYTQPYSIVISSATSGSASDRAALLPRVSMLGADYEPLRSFDEATLRQRAGTFELTVFVNARNAAERHLVVYGTDTAAPIQRTVPNVIAAQSGAAMVFLGIDIQRTLRAAVTGRLTLQVEGLAAH